MTKLYLISCTKNKSEIPCKTKEMYWKSCLFKMAWEYAENKGKIMILSAKHGLLDPEEFIEPYDKSLTTTPYKLRMIWAHEVHKNILPILKVYNITEIIFLTGRYYFEYLKDLLLVDGYSIQLPLNGMGIGIRMKYFKECINKGI